MTRSVASTADQPDVLHMAGEVGESLGHGLVGHGRCGREVGARLGLVGGEPAQGRVAMPSVVEGGDLAVAGRDAVGGGKAFAAQEPLVDGVACVLDGAVAPRFGVGDEHRGDAVGQAQPPHRAGLIARFGQALLVVGLQSGGHAPLAPDRGECGTHRRGRLAGG